MSTTVDTIASKLGLSLGANDRQVSDIGSEETSWLRTQIECCPGPAFAMTSKRQILASNKQGMDLLERMGLEAKKLMDQDITVCLGRKGMVQSQIRAEGEDMEQVLDATYISIPGPQDHWVLLLTKDISLDYHFRQALVASRRLFKDLVSCSADFAWETRPDGTFSYVSQRGALGYSAIDLDGMPASRLMHVTRHKNSINPFGTQQPIGDEEVELIGANGDIAIVRVSCVPVFSRTQRWLGARGVCRDITEVKARDRMLAKVQENERISHSIISAIHSEVRPEEMLTTAVEIISDEMDTRDCWIVEMGTSGRILARSSQSRDLDFSVFGQTGDLDRTDLSERYFELQDGQSELLFVHCGYGSVCKGYLVLGKPSEFGPWSQNSKELMSGLSNHLGVVISQLELMQRLEDLSRTDELTRLLNRRAFNEEIGRRLSHAQRMSRCSALLYLDLDNFKAVNDIRGHADGDFVLKAFAKMLKEGSRAGDNAGRIGGDEFVMWLEETSIDGAKIKARSILEKINELNDYSGSPDKPLGVSIGIALAPADETTDIDQLFALADHAMYEVKRAGKSSFALARSIEEPAEIFETQERT